MSDPTDRSRRQWHFDWRLLVFAGFFLPVLLGLGIWQLERAGEKQAQLEQWQQQAGNLSWSQHLAAGLEAFPVAFPARFLTGFIAQRLQLGLMLKRLALFRVDRGRAGGARVAGAVQFPHPPAAPA
jgi:hypothetical protein